MKALALETSGDGVLLVSLDVPGEKVNTLGRTLIAEFDSWLAGLESGATRARAVILRSGKPDSFIAGGDIKDFAAIQSALEGETLSRLGQSLMNRIAALPIPTVAALHGSCLGGGLELALACSYRIATDDPKTVLAFPEVQLGLVPGAGGSQRAPRLIGLRGALDLILTGRRLNAACARKLGLVDEVVPEAVLAEAARRAGLALANEGLRPRRQGLPALDRILKPLVLWLARAEARKKSGGHYPAPLRAIELVERGTATTLAEGLRLEAQAFGELSVSPVSRALISIFFATREIKKDTGVPEGTPPRAVGKLAVLGAGLMGAGIAGAAVEAGIPVRLKDQNAALLAKGLRHVRAAFEERARRGNLSEREVRQRMDRIAPSTDRSGFRHVDLVIEAVFEDLELKRRVLAETEAITGDDCVFGSNTSALPIGEIAREAKRPQRVLGMHFFSPVNRMPLLEVVVTSQTDAWATATAVAFGRRLGKHVIVVRDGPGFYTTRALGPYLNEAARVLDDGARIEDVDRAMTQLGFPVGPLALLDEVGLDVGRKVAQTLHQAYGERMAPPEAMLRVLDEGRLGRKVGRGFYRYDGKEKRPDASIYALLLVPERRPIEAREIQERLLFAFLNEAALCLQEGILRSPRDGDVGAVFGLGFPAYLGGPFRYLDQLGARFAVEVLERLARERGPRFSPAPALRAMAQAGKRYY